MTEAEGKATVERIEEETRALVRESMRGRFRPPLHLFGTVPARALVLWEVMDAVRKIPADDPEIAGNHIARASRAFVGVLMAVVEDEVPFK